MAVTALPCIATDSLLIRPWPDPVIDRVGHDPRSAYVERFWLGILGPSSVSNEPKLRYPITREESRN